MLTAETTERRRKAISRHDNISCAGQQNNPGFPYFRVSTVTCHEYKGFSGFYPQCGPLLTVVPWLKVGLRS